jgi:hypothetical protein
LTSLRGLVLTGWIGYGASCLNAEAARGAARLQEALSAWQASDLRLRLATCFGAGLMVGRLVSRIGR